MTKPTKNKTKNKPKSNGQMVPKNQVTSMIQNAVRAAIKTVPQKQSFLGEIGSFAGNGISKIFGLGAYKLSSNSLFDSKTGSQVPFMHSTDESIVFRHREYIGDISSTVAFASSAYAINPALPESFPFLSTIASCFQEYRFRGLVYEFKSTSAVALVNGTNTAMGYVALAAQYRSDAVALNNKLDVLNNMWTAEGRPSDSFILPIECAPKENPMNVLYTRSGLVTGDQKLYDLASITVATGGSPGANVVGELWASYEIELLKPQVSPTGGLIGNAKARSSDFASATPCGATVNVEYNALDLVFSPTAITFPARMTGKFLIDLCYLGSVAGVITGPAVTLTNCAAWTIFNNNSNQFNSAPVNGVSSVVFKLSIAVSLTGNASAALVTLGTAGVFPTGTLALDMIVTQLDTYTL